MKIHRKYIQCNVVVLAMAVGASAARATDDTHSFYLVPEGYWVDSGAHDGPIATVSGGDNESAAAIDAVSVYTEIISVSYTPWMRIRFGEYNLGATSYVQLMSVVDGDIQYLDADSMAVWMNTSGAFNGPEVELTLFAGAGDRDVFVTVEEVLVANPEDFATGALQYPPPDDGVASICGDFDDRVSSSDSRAGRLFFGGCTGWLVSNTAGLTAGHCGTPDGNLVGVTMEFNVPPSLSNGMPVAADLDDQYPITSVVDFESDGEGEDYAVYRLGTNSNTGANAHIVQGFYHMTGAVPSEGTTLRVTGYGIDAFPPGTGGSGAPCCDWDDDDECNNDCNSDNVTQQTDTGACDDCLVGTAIEHEVDTMPANSGSPIIWNSNGITIAIHAQGGCDSFFSDFDNAGTWLGYGPLRNALNGVLGSNTIHADSVVVGGAPQNGEAIYPTASVASAVSMVANGGQIALVAGSFPAGSGNTFTAGADGKSMTFIAPVGSATVGN